MVVHRRWNSAGRTVVWHLLICAVVLPCCSDPAVADCPGKLSIWSYNSLLNTDLSQDTGWINWYTTKLYSQGWSNAPLYDMRPGGPNNPYPAGLLPFRDMLKAGQGWNFWHGHGGYPKGSLWFFQVEAYSDRAKCREKYFYYLNTYPTEFNASNLTTATALNNPGAGYWIAVRKDKIGAWSRQGPTPYVNTEGFFWVMSCNGWDLWTDLNYAWLLSYIGLVYPWQNNSNAGAMSRAMWGEGGPGLRGSVSAYQYCWNHGYLLPNNPSTPRVMAGGWKAIHIAPAVDAGRWPPVWPYPTVARRERGIGYVFFDCAMSPQLPSGYGAPGVTIHSLWWGMPNELFFEYEISPNLPDYQPITFSISASTCRASLGGGTEAGEPPGPQLMGGYIGGYSGNRWGYPDQYGADFEWRVYVLGGAH